MHTHTLTCRHNKSYLNVWDVLCRKSSISLKELCRNTSYMAYYTRACEGKKVKTTTHSSLLGVHVRMPPTWRCERQRADIPSIVITKLLCVVLTAMTRCTHAVISIACSESSSPADESVRYLNQDADDLHTDYAIALEEKKTCLWSLCDYWKS